MLKLEIKLDENKIIKDHRYKVESIYQALDESFAKFHLRKEVKQDGTVFYYGTGRSNDFVVEDVLYHYAKRMSVS